MRSSKVRLWIRSEWKRKAHRNKRYARFLYNANGFVGEVESIQAEANQLIHRYQTAPCSQLQDAGRMRRWLHERRDQVVAAYQGQFPWLGVGVGATAGALIGGFTLGWGGALAGAAIGGAAGGIIEVSARKSWNVLSDTMIRMDRASVQASARCGGMAMNRLRLRYQKRTRH